MGYESGAKSRVCALLAAAIAISILAWLAMALVVPSNAIGNTGVARYFRYAELEGVVGVSGKNTHRVEWFFANVTKDIKGKRIARKPSWPMRCAWRGKFGTDFIVYAFYAKTLKTGKAVCPGLSAVLLFAPGTWTKIK